MRYLNFLDYVKSCWWIEKDRGNRVLACTIIVVVLGKRMRVHNWQGNGLGSSVMTCHNGDVHGEQWDKRDGGSHIIQQGICIPHAQTRSATMTYLNQIIWTNNSAEHKEGHTRSSAWTASQQNTAEIDIEDSSREDQASLPLGRLVRVSPKTL